MLSGAAKEGTEGGGGLDKVCVGCRTRMCSLLILWLLTTPRRATTVVELTSIVWLEPCTTQQKELVGRWIDVPERTQPPKKEGSTKRKRLYLDPTLPFALRLKLMELM